MKIGILTDFISHDPAYSLCGVVANQAKMLKAHFDLTVFVRDGFSIEEAEPYGPRVVMLDPGKTGSNVVKVDEDSEREISELYEQYVQHFTDLEVILTHDMIYQANMWKYHVAARRFQQSHPKIRWIHWVHSSTNLDTTSKTGRYASEISGAMPSSKLVAMHNEEINRKGSIYGYERDEIVVIPNPIDVMEDYHELTERILFSDDYWQADVVAVYPARLDRGKQVEIVGEIFRELQDQGWDARVIVVDFHSTAGDKADYRTDLSFKFGDFMRFTSQIYPTGMSYHAPHKVVMDLFDYADVFIHPSKSESDPLTIPEAMWKRNLLMLNFDLPVFRQHDGRALFGKFSSAIDVTTGEPGDTNTEYGNRRDYMKEKAAQIAYMMKQDMILANHADVRRERSLRAVMWKYLHPAIMGGV